MAITIEATYEDGILKPATPLPFQQHQRLQITVDTTVSVSEQTYGLLGWKGDAETFDRLLAESNT